jgi:putative oxidoreductase
MNLGTAAIRGVIGPLFVGHGAQKLWGKFGGHGLEGTGGYFEQLGLRPGRKHAQAAGAAELAGGALLTLGALTPVATTLISGTMVTAIRKAHAQNGPWVTEGGWEYNAALIATMTALAEAGPGRPSVDDALFPRLRGAGIAVASLAAAVAGSYLVTERFSEAEAPAPEEGHAVPGDPAANDDATDDARFTRDPAQVETPAGGTFAS